MIANLLSKIYMFFFFKRHKKEISAIKKELFPSIYSMYLITVRWQAGMSGPATIYGIEERNDEFRRRIHQVIEEGVIEDSWDPEYWIYMAQFQFPWIKSNWSKEEFWAYVSKLGPFYIEAAQIGIDFFKNKLPY